MIVITRKHIVEVLAQELAGLQRKADIWYYEHNNQDHSSWLVDQVYPVVDIARSLGIVDKVYARAYELYDFRNSGKSGYTLKDGKIVLEGKNNGSNS